jgi:hypothetical protein
LGGGGGGGGELGNSLIFYFVAIEENWRFTIGDCRSTKNECRNPEEELSLYRDALRLFQLIIPEPTARSAVRGY